MRIDAARYEGGELILTTSDADARRLVYEFQPGEYELRQAKKRRSLDANSYAWVLIDNIAAATGLTKTEVYRNAIREIGGVSTTTSVSNAAVDEFCSIWASRGLGWQTQILYNDGAYTILNCMYGSSVYDTQQMSRLIDQLVQDAQALGIETLPPYKLERMIQAWDAARGRERSR